MNKASFNMSDSTSIPKKIELAAKILIIGNSEVGKSSILSRFTDNYFAYHMPKTIGTSFFSLSQRLIIEK